MVLKEMLKIDGAGTAPSQEAANSTPPGGQQQNRRRSSKKLGMRPITAPQASVLRPDPRAMFHFFFSPFHPIFCHFQQPI